MLQVKPVLCIRDGLVTPLERVRTFDRALNRIVELTREVDRGHGLCVIVGHADAEADAERVARELEPVAETLLIQPLGPVVGAHAGPGVVGVGCTRRTSCPCRSPPGSSPPPIHGRGRDGLADAAFHGQRLQVREPFL